jgi:hypothetical protein
MLFFFKPKKIYLDCFTFLPHAHEYFKLDHATSFYPDWWKKLPKEYVPDPPYGNGLIARSTIKRCQGLIDLYTNGIVMPLWTDLTCRLDPQSNPRQMWELFPANPDTEFKDHEVEQFQGFLDHKKYQHVKLYSAWMIKCKEDVKWTFNQPIWNFENLGDLTVLPGILDFKYQNSTNINLILKRDNHAPKIINLTAGQPMVHMVPMDNRDIVINSHLVSKEEFNNFNRLSSLAFKFSHIYKNNKISRDKQECPFK